MYLDLTDFEVDPEHGTIRTFLSYYPQQFVLYRNLSDLGYANGTFENSRLELPRFAYNAQFVPSQATDYSLLVDDNSITRMRRDSVAFKINDRTLGRTVVPTGHHPSAVAAMPALTG